ncbi:pirin-like C-terminal cupin domain-containing protein [Rodentibacter caecimuris]|uniref:pirin-like C-terminal cupin domain-containing protein n=3 Tax=Rodentibacter caecimuris TaxID=1796644 RepID=UPI000855D64F|nr:MULTISPECIES: pirin-like C-terminal cupin domain-containing protein [Pasteurellaceae]AOF53638.1 Pirin-related protein [Pasteurellaceae bacterium NI1060]MCR1837619.1 hypothetical protein [Pasteurella caecimuris]MCU0106696.1 hypothetical protein [Pasteurella caecimuris]MCX2961953.1 hypothetical protein [Rodentibacter heylii]
MQFKHAQAFEIDRVPSFEYGILVLKGEIKVNGVSYKADELAVLFDCQHANMALNLWEEAGTHIMLLVGEPLPHSTVMWWNFVAGSKEALEQAVEDWNNGPPRFSDINLDGSVLKRLPAPQVPNKLR